MIRTYRTYRTALRSRSFALASAAVAVQAIGIGAVLLLDDPRTYYATLRAVAPLWLWGVLFAGVGLWHLVAYARLLEALGADPQRRRFFAPAVLLSMLYAALGTAYTLTSGLTTALPGYLVDTTVSMMVLILTEPPLWVRRPSAASRSAATHADAP